MAPFFSKLFSIILAISSSSKGNILSALSIKLTFVLPKPENMVANSQPITPAPKTTMLLGSEVKLLIPSLVTIISLSILMFSGTLGRLPVAIKI